ncbi:MAG TPA: HlyD family efflux transporter periplasmic adaptor subunit [Gemmatimonadaceae bacterium]|nr:HlyD family efflux transporter periplasmic adaptor subunit [Gemmatimonadaceae bacterium]
MDIVRAPRKKTGRNIGIALGVVAIAAATWGLSNLKPAAPSVEGENLLTDTVSRGDIVREVRGPGTLVAERIVYITPQANGRVVRIAALAGANLVPGQVILEMSSPDQEIAMMRAEQAVRQEQLNLATLRNALTSQRFSQEVSLASAKTANVDAQQRASEADSLFRLKLMPQFELNRIKSTSEEAATRFRVASEQLAMTIQAADSQLAVAAANVEALKAIAANERTRLQSLIVRATEAGVLRQDQTLQPGQWVVSGQTVGMIVQPGKLKAVLRIPESQARDVNIGQIASIDTRNGVIPGRVSRKDPTATGGSVLIDVALEGALPAGAVPDLSIDGTVELEKLTNVLYTGRPVSGAATGPVGLFKYVEGGDYAVRITVRLGRSSVNTVEILDGLQVGDRVILSAMDAYDNVDRVRIK